ncbi:MAG: TraB/GumN family protein [Gammaproteobacteria bacterium]|nr:TraB/GumN family protein [Gammaproteobacteria bacterium]MBL4728755.1 TraB/GumN family protein [Gammaproteobacteria bacterium]
MQKLMKSIRRPYTTVICVFLLSFSQLKADTSVWSVRSGDNVVYLGGTVHLLRPGDYPLPDEFEEAYRASSELYFETDMAAMSDLSVQVQMLQQLTYGDDKSLSTVLSDEAYAALTAYTATAGLPMVMLDKFKPGLLISTLQILVFQSMGFTPQGVDAFFHTRAVADGKAEGQLETVQEQIGFIAAMGEGNESEFILLSLEELAEIGDVIESMIGAWRSGDTEGLSELFVEDMKIEAPALYDSLLLQRNLRWIPQIDSMLQDADTEFVLVGAAHIVGENGLLDLLSQKGYEINQL